MLLSHHFDALQHFFNFFVAFSTFLPFSNFLTLFQLFCPFSTFLPFPNFFGEKYAFSTFLPFSSFFDVMAQFYRQKREKAILNNTPSFSADFCSFASFLITCSFFNQKDGNFQFFQIFRKFPVFFCYRKEKDFKPDFHKILILTIKHNP